MLTVCVPTLNNFSGLDAMIVSMEQGTMVPKKYLVIDNSCGKYVSNYNPKVEILVPSVSQSVASCWNYMIKNTEGIRLICNDDLIFYKDTLEIFYNAMKSDTESLMWCSEINSGLAYSCFGISDRCITELGYFDETFYPAYFEDCDYARRMLLAGKEITKIPKCDYFHAHSATMHYYSHAELQVHHTNFAKNQAYYIKKWGGLPGKEIFNIPFNGKVLTTVSHRLCSRRIANFL